MATIFREILVIFLSAVAAMIIPFALITYGALRSPRLAYALMFWLYAQCYLLLKKYFLKASLTVRPLEFELVSLALTAYMAILVPIIRDQSEIVQLLSCYWTFIFVSFYVSMRGKRHNNYAPPSGADKSMSGNSGSNTGPTSVT